VIDLKSHFDKIKYPGTIRDLFHTFWILFEDKSREGRKMLKGNLIILIYRFYELREHF